jgi:hypothetical protein
MGPTRAGAGERTGDPRLGSRFDSWLREWVGVACDAWHYPEPDEAYYERLRRRVPEGLRALIALGVADGLVVPEGAKFTLRGLPGKGPYAWFSRRSTPKEPTPNWEYFVQAAEFVRLTRIAVPRGFVVTFEDQLMDLGLYRDGRLIVCCEVKERAGQIHGLVKRMQQYESGVDLSQRDRGNDPLRKAKYLVTRRPEYLALVGIGVRLEYKVAYSEDRGFRLARDVIPWI